MKAIEKLIDLFKDFIKRSVIPTLSFAFILVIEYFFFTKEINSSLESILKTLKEFKGIEILNNDLYTIIIIIIWIGLSYTLTILHQLFYDNLLKKNFNFICKKHSYILNEYRKRVVKKLKKDEIEFKDFSDNFFNDNLLYQIIGKKITIDTKRYVDEVKSSGIFFISLSLSLIFIAIISNSTLSAFIYIGLSILNYYIGFEYIKSKYRSRAIRIYTNYLIGDKSTPKPPSKNENTISLKIEK